MRARYNHKFRRLTEIAFQNIGRNLLLSAATTIMMGLILFIFNVIMVLNILTSASLDDLAQKVDLLLYISDEASLLDVTKMIDEIKSLPVVTSVKYTSKEDALKEFIALYPDKSDPFTVYGIENPLPGNIQVITAEPNQHELVVDYLEETAYASLLIDTESSNENQEIVTRLLSVTGFTKKLIIGVIVTFVFGSLLMIMNAIHLSIFTRKREIQIMQLVGAKPNMIRYPFIVEGALYSLVAVFFSFILLIFFLEGTNLTSFASFQENFEPATLFLSEILASLIIGSLSSHLAINYYLKRTLVLQT